MLSILSQYQKKERKEIWILKRPKICREQFQFQSWITKIPVTWFCAAYFLIVLDQAQVLHVLFPINIRFFGTDCLANLIPKKKANSHKDLSPLH